MGRRTGIFRKLSVGIQSADVADADGVSVMETAVSAFHFLWSSRFDGAVSRDDIMVSASPPPSGAMVFVDVFHSDSTAFTIGRAMYDNKRDSSHKSRYIGILRN